MTKKFSKKKINTKLIRKTKKRGQLFSDDNPSTTIKGYGFKNKEIAEFTLEDLKNRDIDYQFQVVNTMYHRGKVVLKKTKDIKTQNNIKQALNIFDKWLSDFKKNKNKLQFYNYLSVKTVNDLEFLADFYNISLKARGLQKSTKSDKGFLEIWRQVNGDKKKLRNMPVLKSVPNGETWDKHRNNYLKRRLSMLKNTDNKLYYDSGKFKGLPTKLHVNMLMWAYCPEKNHAVTKGIEKYKQIIANLTQ